MIKRTYKVADFFSGCGGLSCGFELSKRFQVVLGSDVKSEALDTFVRNHSEHHVPPEGLLEDIQNLKPSQVQKILSKFDITGIGQLDCLIGGPPCEGFSQNRSIGAGGLKTKSALRVNRFMDDPRNKLFRWYIELANHLKPAVILIENVPDLVRHQNGDTLREILTALDQAGYIVSVRVLNAADFGVPQMRRRAIFLAQRKSDFERTGLKLQFPTPTHIPFPLQQEALEQDVHWLPSDSGYWATVWEAIGDLPTPTGAAKDHGVDPHYPDVPLSNLRRILRSGTHDRIFNHVARTLGKNGLEKVKSISKGQRAADMPKHLRPRASYHLSYARLRWAEPARTITKFCYHVGSGMFAHPLEDRAITMREAARLQSFPDSFRFYSDNIRDLSAMIGSAVPPLLASRLAASIAQYLDALQFLSLTPKEKLSVKKQATDAVLRHMEGNEWDSSFAVSSQRKLI